jgi:hypothetical protein
MRHSKVIIWGAKPDTRHTHAFVHEALVRASQHEGYQTYWLDNRDNLPDEFFDDALIISEQWLVFQNGISNNLPLRPTSTYIIHYLGNKGPVEGNPGADMYLGKVGRLIDFRFACNWGVNGVVDKNYAYYFEKEKYTPINHGTSFFESGDKYDIFYSIWATDLLPNEINFENRFRPFHEPKYASFGGSITQGWQSKDDGNYDYVVKFAEECKKHNIPFVHNDPHKNPLPSEQLKEFVLNSYLPFEVRPNNHLANGYMSCRSIKNVSYGCLGITNSKTAYDFFDQEIAYSADTGELFYIAKEMQDNPKTKDLILNQMKKVKEKHTYINRLNDMIEASEMAWQK